METAAPSAVPPPLGGQQTGKARTSGWAVAALVCGILLVPLLPVVFGIVALSRISRDRGRTGGTALAVVAIVLGGAELVVGLLAALATPAIIRAKKKADLMQATNHLKQLGVLMSEFEYDWGEFPSRKVFEANREHFAGLTPADDANFYLGMLVAGGYTESEEIFYAKGGSSSAPKRPDNVVNTPDKVLEKGECGFGYVLLQDGKAMKAGDRLDRSLVVAPLVAGSGGSNPQFDPKPFDGKAVYLRLDQSVNHARIKDGRPLVIQGSTARPLFATGPGSAWEKDVPDVKPPR